MHISTGKNTPEYGQDMRAGTGISNDDWLFQFPDTMIIRCQEKLFKELMRPAKCCIGPDLEKFQVQSQEIPYCLRKLPDRIRIVLQVVYTGLMIILMILESCSFFSCDLRVYTSARTGPTPCHIAYSRQQVMYRVVSGSMDTGWNDHQTKMPGSARSGSSGQRRLHRHKKIPCR